MAYPICDFILGWLLTEPYGKPDPLASVRSEINDLCEDDIVIEGGAYDSYLYLGVDIGSIGGEHESAQEVIDALTPSDEDFDNLQDAIKLFEQHASPALIAAITAMGPPTVFTAWTHS